VQRLHEKVGRGKDHISALYKSFCKTGKIHPDLPLFSNAQALFGELTALIDDFVPVPHVVQELGLTKKFLLKTRDGFDIESVVITMKEGNTLCVSSQIGCKMGCAFCETGKMGLLRNLTVEEIAGQLFAARFHLKENIRNIVFMGMGEPFDNYDAVMGAIDVFTDQNGFAIGMHRITVSTSGRLDGIEKLTVDPIRFPNLAVSVNAAEDTLRSKLMSWNRKENLQALYNAIKVYNEKTGRQVLAAYVLIGGVNDTLPHAEALAVYLQGLSVKVNLIPYNPQARDPYRMPEAEVVDAFMQCLRKEGYQVLLRKTKGSDGMAACGQLGNRALKIKR
jgi:23S rRNA (adenine2503-C2)-methyltransferase